MEDLTSFRYPLDRRPWGKKKKNQTAGAALKNVESTICQDAPKDIIKALDELKTLSLYYREGCD